MCPDDESSPQARAFGWVNGGPEEPPEPTLGQEQRFEQGYMEERLAILREQERAAQISLERRLEHMRGELLAAQVRARYLQERLQDEINARAMERAVRTGEGRFANMWRRPPKGRIWWLGVGFSALGSALGYVALLLLLYWVLRW